MATLFDSLKGPDGNPPTMSFFNAYLSTLAQNMFDRGWTVIGSRFKTPNLHPWKNPTRTALLYWAKQDLQMLRANSLNLRLADTQTVALDCDFNDPKLMEVFVSEVSSYLSLSKGSLYTCAGKKGGKLFFRLIKGTLTDKPSRSLGPTVFTLGHAGDSSFKQELEVKSDLSTFAGLYGTNEKEQLIIYGPYADFPFIGNASPSQLPALSLQELEAIGLIYRRLVSKGEYVSEAGFKLLDDSDRELNRAAVCYYYLSLWRRLIAKHQSEGKAEPTAAELSSFADCNPVYLSHFRPLFQALGLDNASRLCGYIFNREGGHISFSQMVDVDVLVPKLSIDTYENQRNLMRQGGFFVKATRQATDRFYSLGASLKFDPNQPVEDVFFALRESLKADRLAEQKAKAEQAKAQERQDLESLNEMVPMPLGGANGNKFEV